MLWLLFIHTMAACLLIMWTEANEQAIGAMLLQGMQDTWRTLAWLGAAVAPTYFLFRYAGGRL